MSLTTGTVPRIYGAISPLSDRFFLYKRWKSAPLQSFTSLITQHLTINFYV